MNHIDLAMELLEAFLRTDFDRSFDLLDEACSTQFGDLKLASTTGAEPLVGRLLLQPQIGALSYRIADVRDRNLTVPARATTP